MSGFKFIGRKALGGQSAGSGRHISQVVQNLFILTDLGPHEPPSSPGFALVKRGSVDPSKKSSQTYLSIILTRPSFMNCRWPSLIKLDRTPRSSRDLSQRFAVDSETIAPSASWRIEITGLDARTRLRVVTLVSGQIPPSWSIKNIASRFLRRSSDSSKRFSPEQRGAGIQRFVLLDKCPTPPSQMLVELVLVRGHFVFDLQCHFDQMGNALRKFNGKARWIGEVGHASIQVLRTKWPGLRPPNCGELRRSVACVNDWAAITRFGSAKPAENDEKSWPKSSFW